jgi:very-short-patch-repair endonuclease
MIKSLSVYEDILAALLKEKGISFEREYRFSPPRRFRSDFAILSKKILIEVEGAIYTGGRHTRGSGYEKDCEKYNLAASLGYIVYRIPTTWIKANDPNMIQVLSFLEDSS